MADEEQFIEGGGGGGAILLGGLMIRSCQVWGSFTNIFFSIIFHFSNHEGIYT